MTHRIFDTDVMQKSCTATVTSCYMDAGEAKFLMKRLQALPKTVSTLLYRHGDRLNYIVEVADDADADASAILRELNTHFGGKGAVGNHTTPKAAPPTRTKRSARQRITSNQATNKEAFPPPKFIHLRRRPPRAVFLQKK